MAGIQNNGFNWFARNKLVNTESTLSAPAIAAGVTKSNKIGATKLETYRFTNTNVVITDTGGANGAQGSIKLVDLPEGLVIFSGGSANLIISKVGAGITATAAVVASVGTAAAANTDSTLTSTEANIVPSTVATLTAGAGVAKGESTGGATVDGTATAVPVFLNFAIPDNGVTATDALLVNGTVTIMYAVIGDN